MSQHEELVGLLRAANRGSYTERIGAAEMACVLADQIGDLDSAWEAREALVQASAFGGAPEKCLMGFAWLESHVESDPERFPMQDILWSYKWVCEKVPEFSQISRASVESTIERMRVAYETCGVSLRPYYAARARAASMMDGNTDALRNHMENYAMAPRDRYADCRACETHFATGIALLVDDYDRAHQLALPIVNGKEKCSEIPHLTYGLLTVPSWQAGFQDRARLYHQRGYDLCRTTVDFLEAISAHLHFTLVSDNEEQAVEIFERHISWALDSHAGWRRLHFLESALALLKRLESRDSQRKFAVPQAWKNEAKASVEVSEMKNLVDQELTRLVAAMDARNQNEWVSGQVARHLESLA